jgi:hypothetical protein
VTSTAIGGKHHHHYEATTIIKKEAPSLAYLQLLILIS